jgi:hypothetical protein
MGGPTGFHDHQSDGAVVKPPLKLGSTQSRSINDSPVLVSNSDLENALCQIYSNGRSIHLGLLPGCADSDTTSGWSKPIAVLFMILAPVLTFIVVVTVNPAPQGIFGTPDEKRQAIGQLRTTMLIWVVVAAVMLAVFKVAH